MSVLKNGQSDTQDPHAGPGPVTAARTPAPARAGGQESSEQGPDVSAILHAVRRRWLPALLLGLIAGGAVAAAAWRFTPQRFTGRSLLQVGSTQPSILFQDLDGRTNALSYQRAQLAMLKSRQVLNAAVDRPEVAALPLVQSQGDPVAWLEKELKADYKLAPEVMQVTLSGPAPEGLVEVIDAVRDAYLREVVDRERNDRLHRLETLRKLHAGYEKDRHEKRARLAELAGEAGPPDAQAGADERRLAKERASEIQKNLLQVQTDLRKARTLPASFTPPEGEEAVPAELIEEQLGKDPTISRQEAEVARLQAVYEKNRENFVRGDSEPLLERYRAPLEEARRALATRKAQIRAQAASLHREKERQRLQLAAAQRKQKVEELETTQAHLLAESRRLEGQAAAARSVPADTRTLQEEIANIDEMAKKAAGQLEALKVELEAPQRVIVLEEAYLAEGEGPKKRLMATVGGALGAFALVAGALIWWDLRARWVNSLNDAKQGLGMRVLGVLPDQARPNRASQVEAADAVRTVLLATALPETRSILVTSAVCGEGKTSVAVHLAASLARVGYRTLLVDGDLRRPAVHERIKVTPDVGLSQVLRGEVELADAVQPTPMKSLWVLAAGGTDEASLQSLAREDGQEVFRRLRAQYDFVVVDSPPVLPVADTLLLGRCVDGVIFALRRDVSQMDPVAAACERVSILGSPVLGVVMNGFSADLRQAAQGYMDGAKRGEPALAVG